MKFHLLVLCICDVYVFMCLCVYMCLCACVYVSLCVSLCVYTQQTHRDQRITPELVLSCHLYVASENQIKLRSSSWAPLTVLHKPLNTNTPTKKFVLGRMS